MGCDEDRLRLHRYRGRHLGEEFLGALSEAVVLLYADDCIRTLELGCACSQIKDLVDPPRKLVHDQ